MADWFPANTCHWEAKKALCRMLGLSIHTPPTAPRFVDVINGRTNALLVRGFPIDQFRTLAELTTATTSVLGNVFWPALPQPRPLHSPFSRCGLCWPQDADGRLQPIVVFLPARNERRGILC
jgi:hypothetical protein